MNSNESISERDIEVILSGHRGWHLYPSSVSLRKLLSFLNPKTLIERAIAQFFENNNYLEREMAVMLPA